MQSSVLRDSMLDILKKIFRSYVDMSNLITVLTQFQARVVICCFIFFSIIATLSNSAQAAEQVGSSAVNPAQQYFTDVILVDQDGEPQRFYNDLLKDKVVLINSFFTSCEGSCPRIMRLIAGIQERFSDQMGQSLHIISISLDPISDTPPQLKTYAKEINAGPGWQLITGKKDNVDFALKKLGHFVADIQAHKNTVIVGNEATGLWKKVFILAKRDALDKVITSVLEDTIPELGS